VELDVRLDASGEVIVFHDPTLTRLTDNRDQRHTEDVTSSELARIDIGRGERIPKLKDVLDWARSRNQLVNVEVKSDVRRPLALLAAVARLLDGAALPPVILSSFQPGFVFFLARRLPRLPAAWLVHNKQRILKHSPGFRLLGASAVHPEAVLATRERVRQLKSGHALVNVWTVNDTQRARELADAGVDAIISDEPGKILQALRQ
jgi:glycerophosphoryl diester phosphodiesterase